MESPQAVGADLGLGVIISVDILVENRQLCPPREVRRGSGREAVGLLSGASGATDYGAVAASLPPPDPQSPSSHPEGPSSFLPQGLCVGSFCNQARSALSLRHSGTQLKLGFLSEAFPGPHPGHLTLLPQVVCSLPSSSVQCPVMYSLG